MINIRKMSSRGEIVRRKSFYSTLYKSHLVVKYFTPKVEIMTPSLVSGDRTFLHSRLVQF